ncbi:MAG TPA: ABC-F family ATP-binding cassette domain-containing protein [Candidatus Bathyarchaeia archaeon]|nr:ABC-F family ATP-binding cassette domain-containing protein [Candidatus Bathyarchaeia archaeon]
MIQLDRVQRRFGPQLLFDGLTWLIPRGARLGLVGPNGAGKTTLLRLLAGDDHPDAGAVRRAGTVRVGYLPQDVEAAGSGSVLSAVLDGHGELRKLEEQLEAATVRLASLAPGDPRLSDESEAYGALRHRFEALGGDRLEADASAILSGLGVPRARFHEPLANLSGGWRMRVALSRLLLARPDLLLLDEPTNHLDLEAMDWLERFLAGWEGAFVVVSHDRYFLNRMVRGVVELDRGKLTEFTGGYDDYLEAREARQAALEQEAAQQAREIARVERFIERFRYKATKARQVQSRVKALEKIERVEAPSRRKSIRFGFPPPPRSGDQVVNALGVAKSYGENAVFSGLDLRLRRGDRLALVGPNGAGKSTLLKLVSGRLTPDAGTLVLGHNVVLETYAQHQLEALDPKDTVLQSLERVSDAGARPRLRSLLGAFLFHGDDVEKRIAVLSGGEKARVALARMLVRPSNLLLLDEPTNHLDLASREVLEDALDEYEGTLVVVSHDRYFINRVATAILEVGGGRATLYAGDYDTFLERHAGDAVVAPLVNAKDEKREARRAEAEERNRRYRERTAFAERIGPVEKEIEHLEARLKAIEAERADPATYRDQDRSRELGRESSEITRALESLYIRWEELAAEAPKEDASPK